MPEQTLKYTVIKSKAQYREYTRKLEQLDATEHATRQTEDEIELLSLLIEKWDSEHNTFSDVDPVMLIKGLLQEKGLKPADLSRYSGLSKGLVSDILNYRKGMSKDVIRFFASFFKLSQEALNRPYALRKRPEAGQRRQQKTTPPQQSQATCKKGASGTKKQYA